VSEQLLQGSILFVLLWLLGGGLGGPLPEDAALIATGVLIERGAVHPALALGVVVLGVLGGDAMLFFLARRLGPAAYERTLFQRILPPERRRRIEDAFTRFGGRLVFAARFIVGMRAAVFAIAGIHGLQPRRFLLWDAAAASISIPVVVGVGYLGSHHVARMRAGVATVEHAIFLAALAAVLGYLAFRQVRRRRRSVT